MEYKSELHLQQIIWLWFYNTYPEYRLPSVGKIPRCLLIHNLLNPRSKVEGAKLVSCGLTKGFPDLTLFVAKKGYHALHIELKKPPLHKGLASVKPRKEQLEVLGALEIQGYKCVVCDTHEDAQRVIIDYLG